MTLIRSTPCWPDWSSSLSPASWSWCSRCRPPCSRPRRRSRSTRRWRSRSSVCWSRPRWRCRCRHLSLWGCHSRPHPSSEHSETSCSCQDLLVLLEDFRSHHHPGWQWPLLWNQHSLWDFYYCCCCCCFCSCWLHLRFQSYHFHFSWLNLW